MVPVLLLGQVLKTALFLHQQVSIWAFMQKWLVGTPLGPTDSAPGAGLSVGSHGQCGDRWAPNVLGSVLHGRRCPGLVATTGPLPLTRQLRVWTQDSLRCSDAVLETG